jgi:hypothetical protein
MRKEADYGEGINAHKVLMCSHWPRQQKKENFLNFVLRFGKWCVAPASRNSANSAKKSPKKAKKREQPILSTLGTKPSISTSFDEGQLLGANEVGAWLMRGAKANGGAKGETWGTSPATHFSAQTFPRARSLT